MPLVRFRAPGSRDLPPASPFHDRWHDLVAALIRPRTSPAARGVRRPEPGDRGPERDPRLHLDRLPAALLMQHRDDRGRRSRRARTATRSIEYLEWHVTATREKDHEGHVHRPRRPSTGAAGGGRPRPACSSSTASSSTRRSQRGRPVRPGGPLQPENPWNTTARDRPLRHADQRDEGRCSASRRTRDPPGAARLRRRTARFPDGTRDRRRRALQHRHLVDDPQGTLAVATASRSACTWSTGTTPAGPSPTGRRSATTGGSCAGARMPRCGSSTRCRPRRASWSATSGSAAARSATAASSPSTSR